MNRPDWSIIIPLHNEAGSLPELLARLERTVARLPGRAEVLLVDDASTDTTPQLLAAANYPPFSSIRLPTQSGQLQATLAGLAHCTGHFVAVMDGDLQDPPEILLDLHRTLAEQPSAEVVLAVKSAREDGFVMRTAAAVFRGVERWVLGAGLPAGVGSCCAMRRSVRDALVANQDVWPRYANLATLLGVLRRPLATVCYAKAMRRHGESRVGWSGLLREAANSLVAARLYRRRVPGS